MTVAGDSVTPVARRTNVWNVFKSRPPREDHRERYRSRLKRAFEDAEFPYRARAKELDALDRLDVGFKHPAHLYLFDLARVRELERFKHHPRDRHVTYPRIAPLLDAARDRNARAACAADVDAFDHVPPSEWQKFSLEVGNGLIGVRNMRNNGNRLAFPFGDTDPGGLDHGEHQFGDEVDFRAADGNGAPVLGPGIVEELEQALERREPGPVGETVGLQLTCMFPRLVDGADASQTLPQDGAAHLHAEGNEVHSFGKAQRIEMARVVRRGIVRAHHVGLIEPLDQKTNFVID